MTPFSKAHGLGNDFILVERTWCPADAGPWARRLCDRHEGIGGDGVLVYFVEGGRVHMRLINADGSDAEISGNGVRCLAAWAVRQKLVPPRHVVQTTPGPRPVSVEDLGGSRYRVSTDLGPAILGSRDIPVLLDPPRDRVIDHALKVAGETVLVTPTSLGNPHCAVFMDAPPDDARLVRLGAALEPHPFFPRKTNVEFVSVPSRGEIRVRFWERGVGYTRASGTGSASAAVAAIVKGLADRKLRVVCDGGTLDVEWPEGGHVHQVGEVEVLFGGEWLAEGLRT